jgi:hypothetical protein
MTPCKKALIRLIVCASSVPFIWAQAGAGTATIRRVTVFRSGNAVEVEISANQPLTPEAQFVTGPDRLVLDFANATPGSDLRPVAGLGEMTGVRAGLYKSNPPVTRVVLDLKSAQPYQLFPSGNNVIVKLGGTDGASAPSAATAMPEVSTDDIPPALPPIQRTAKLDVRFQNGKLSIWSNKATLAEVLFEVHKRTGAEIGIPAGAEQERVVTNISAAPPREAMAALLNGSRFNFIMVGASGDSSLRSVILSPREGGAPMISTYTPPASAMAQAPPEPVPDQPEQDATQDAPQQPVEGAEEPIPARDQPDPNNPPR